MEEVQLDAIGVAIEKTITNQDGAVVDVSSATTKNIVLKKPSGSLLTKAASLVTDGTDGKIQYVTISGDLDETGRWEVQADIDVSSYDGRDTISAFRVRKNL